MLYKSEKYVIIIKRFGGVAQLGERTVRIRKVKGSNPSVSTKLTLYVLLQSFIWLMGCSFSSVLSPWKRGKQKSIHS